MIIDELATITFVDGDSGNSAVAVVRRCGDKIAVALSIERNGDIEVLLDMDSAGKLQQAIRSGIEMISNTK